MFLLYIIIVCFLLVFVFLLLFPDYSGNMLKPSRTLGARSSSPKSQLALRCRELGDGCGYGFGPNALRKQVVKSPSLSTGDSRRTTKRTRGRFGGRERGEESRSTTSGGDEGRTGRRGRSRRRSGVLEDKQPE
jgi:hypothetical protein